MEFELISKVPIEVLAFIQFLKDIDFKRRKEIIEKRQSCRRNDKRLLSHRRTNNELNDNLNETNKRVDDRRDIYSDRRRQDRRALERIKKI